MLVNTHSSGKDETGEEEERTGSGREERLAGAQRVWEAVAEAVEYRLQHSELRADQSAKQTFAADLCLQVKE